MTTGRLRGIARPIDASGPPRTLGNGFCSFVIATLPDLHQQESTEPIVSALGALEPFGGLAPHAKEAGRFEENICGGRGYTPCGFFVSPTGAIPQINGGDRASEAEPLEILARSRHLATHPYRASWHPSSTTGDRDPAHSLAANDKLPPRSDP